MRTIATLLATWLSMAAAVPAIAHAQRHTRTGGHRDTRAEPVAQAPAADDESAPDPAATTDDAAATTSDDATAPEPPKSEVALELVFHSHGRTWGTEFDFSPALRAEVQLLDWLRVEARWGLAYAAQTPTVDAEASSVRVGSVWLAGYFTRTFGKLALRAGLGVTIPLTSLPSATDPDFVAAGLAYQGAQAMRGRLDPWLFAAPHYFTVALPVVRVDHPVGERIATGAEAAAAYMVHYGDDGPAAQSTLALQLALWGAYTLVSTLQAGLRLGAVWLPGESGDDAQLSLEPYARMSFGPAFARLGFLMNLDRPLGFAFDQVGYWGLRIEGGASF